uniref:Uncharacterized protein n=1 Tax=Ciona savignyi TaxID=51511 RepID=H2YLM5_CIOSA
MGGSGARANVSHSAAMQTIEQVDPNGRPHAGARNGRRKNRYLDPEYDSDSDDDFVVVKKSPSYLRDLESGRDSFAFGKKSTKDEFGPPAYSTSAKKPPSYDVAPMNDEMREKIRGAKSISSDMLFGNNDNDARARVSRFEGQTSISSSDFFEDEMGSNHRRSSTNPQSLLSTDMTQLKEGVRNMAGRLSSMATDVYNAIPINR